VLWPPGGVTALASNERSVVLEIEAGAQRLVLTGDVDSTSEARWLPASRAPVAVLKLGHHGSRGSTAWSTLAALRPAVALASCGAGNRFGHPHPETLARLAALGVAWRRTDLEGTIRLDLGARRPPKEPLRAHGTTPAP
jgi:competence protein ComEC